jgi:hypothetical protein
MAVEEDEAPQLSELSRPPSTAVARASHSSTVASDLAKRILRTHAPSSELVSFALTASKVWYTRRSRHRVSFLRGEIPAAYVSQTLGNQRDISAARAH